MKIDSLHICVARLRHLLVPIMTVASLALASVAQAEPAVAGRQHVASKPVITPLGAPPRQAQATSEVLVMVCRRGVEETPSAQGAQRYAPLLCLATQADEEVVRMGPARFRELLEKAVDSGAMVVFVLPPQ